MAAIMKCMTLMMITLIIMVVMAPQRAQAQQQLALLPSLVRITGTVLCSLNGTNVVNSTIPTLPFANATVQLSCGGTVIQTTLTNSLGIFTIVQPQLQTLLSNLLSVNCTVVVASPLSTCNSTLPATGLLQAPLQVVRTTVFGAIQTVTELITAVFRLV